MLMAVITDGALKGFTVLLCLGCCLPFVLSTLSCRWFTITTVNCVFMQHFWDQFWAFQPLNIWSLHLPNWVSVTIQDSMCSSGPIYTFVYQDATWWAILALDISTLPCPLQWPGISPATFHHSTAASGHKTVFTIENDLSVSFLHS